MIYFANDANGVNKALSGLESIIDAAVAADSTLVKGSDSADNIPDWVAPGKGILVSGTWMEYRVVTIADVQEALHAFLDMCGSVWMLELELYPTVKTFGQGALRIGMQAGINYAQDSTYSEAIRVKGLLNAAEGTADNPSIDSGRALARNADQILPANRVLPDALFLWIDRATGEKLTLPDALGVTWGTIDVNFQLYTRPAVTA